MKSIVLSEPGSFRLHDSEAPAAPGTDAVQVRIRQVGICGTDLHAFEGKQPFFKYPRILGHELAVEIMQIGPTERPHELAVGDRCCVRPYLNCGHCSACRRGFENCCMQLRVLGVHMDGGMQECINVPIDTLHKAPLKDDELALVEMLSIGAHAVRRAQIIPGEYALVIGVGPIGLGVSLFAAQAGARVIALDLSDQRLDFAQRQLGIEHVINAKQNVIDSLKQILSDDLPTVVFDATGSARSMNQSFSYATHGGRIVFVGLTQGDISFNDPEFHRREVTLLASRNATSQDFNQVLQLLSAGKVDITPWITHRAAPEQLIKDFGSWLDPETQVVKAMLEF
jgi:2-desacetyl-2-hydroxyethyl bacteriochlorophyllide A dehydrogenase